MEGSNQRQQLALIIEGGFDCQGWFFLQALKFLANLSILPFLSEAIKLLLKYDSAVCPVQSCGGPALYKPIQQLGINGGAGIQFFTTPGRNYCSRLLWSFNKGPDETM
jgi:hypothetical protein